MKPTQFVIDALAGYTLPVTPEEVMARDFGMSPVGKGLGTFVSVGTLGIAIGAVSQMVPDLISRDFSFKRCAKTGLSAGLQFGLEAGVTEMVETYLGQRRGQAAFYDKIIAGGVAGAVLKVPYGIKPMAKGAAQGAGLAACIVGFQELQKLLQK